MNDHNSPANTPQQPFIRKFRSDDTIEDLMRDFGMTKDEAENTLHQIEFWDIYDQFAVDQNGNRVLSPPYPTWTDLDIDEHGHVWNPPRPGWKLPEWRRKQLEEWGITPPPDPQP